MNKTMQLETAKTFLRQYDELTRKSCTEADWLGLKMGLSPAQAEKLVSEVRGTAQLNQPRNTR